MLRESIMYLPDPDNLSDVDKYWIGYFRADGCLSGRTAQFVQATEEVVLEFCRYLELDASRCRRYEATAVKNGRRYVHYRTSYSGLWPIYEKMGVKKDLIDRSLLSSPHFWRGLVDGDGCVSIRANKAVVLRLCGSQEDVEAFVDFCAKHVNVRPAICPTRSIFTTGVTGNNARFICRLLYKDSYSANRRKRQIAATIYGQPYTNRGRSFDLEDT